MQNKQNKINVKDLIFNFISKYQMVIYLSLFVIFVFLGFKYSLWFTFVYIFIAAFIIFWCSEPYEEDSVFLSSFVVPLIIWLVLIIIYALNIEYNTQEVKITERNIKLLYDEKILFDDMTTLDNKELYYKCLHFKCSKIVETETIKYKEDYNDIFRSINYKTDIGF